MSMTVTLNTSQTSIQDTENGTGVEWTVPLYRNLEYVSLREKSYCSTFTAALCTRFSVCSVGASPARVDFLQ
jgi:hypothetical protein